MFVIGFGNYQRIVAMTLIALQKDFLPTDTLSAVAASDSNGIFMFVAVWGIGIGVVMLYCASRTLITILGAAVVLAGAVMLGVVGTQLENANDDYKAALEESKVADISNFATNIESVYDIEVVLPKVENYSVSPEEKPSVMVIQDGTAYEALVSQNPDTYEPTLIMVASESADITEFRKK